MTDKCAPHPWGKAQNRPSKGGKIKSILLLTTLCNLFAHRQTPDRHAKWIRIISVIYSPTGDQTEKNKRTNNHHNHVFCNTNQRDSHPYASPEGPGTTPSAESQRWSAARPLGAAMRLTASRQPYDISRPKNYRHTKPIPDPQNDYFPPLLCYCKPTSANTEKCGSTVPCRAPYGGAIETTHKLARPNPLPEPTTLNLWTCKFFTLPNTFTDNLLPRVPLPAETCRLIETSRAWRLDDEIKP